MTHNRQRILRRAATALGIAAIFLFLQSYAQAIDIESLTVPESDPIVTTGHGAAIGFTD